MNQNSRESLINGKEKLSGAGQDPRESRDSGFSKKSAADRSSVAGEHQSLDRVKVIDPDYVKNDKRDQNDSKTDQKLRVTSKRNSATGTDDVKNLTGRANSSLNSR